jgi:hypothetical protein
VKPQCGEHLKYYMYTSVKISRSASLIHIFSVGYSMYPMRIRATRKVMADLSWRPALELATGIWEATPWQGDR